MCTLKKIARPIKSISFHATQKVFCPDRKNRREKKLAFISTPLHLFKHIVVYRRFFILVLDPFLLFWLLLLEMRKFDPFTQRLMVDAVLREMTHNDFTLNTAIVIIIEPDNNNISTVLRQLIPSRSTLYRWVDFFVLQRCYPYQYSHYNSDWRA